MAEMARGLYIYIYVCVHNYAICTYDADDDDDGDDEDDVICFPADHSSATPRCGRILPANYELSNTMRSVNDASCE